LITTRDRSFEPQRYPRDDFEKKKKNPYWEPNFPDDPLYTGRPKDVLRLDFRAVRYERCVVGARRKSAFLMYTTRACAVRREPITRVRTTATPRRQRDRRRPLSVRTAPVRIYTRRTRLAAVRAQVACITCHCDCRGRCGDASRGRVGSSRRTML